MSEKACRKRIDCPSPEVVNPWKDKDKGRAKAAVSIYPITDIVDPWARDSGSSYASAKDEIVKPWKGEPASASRGKSDSYNSFEIVSPWKR